MAVRHAKRPMPHNPFMGWGSHPELDEEPSYKPVVKMTLMCPDHIFMGRRQQHLIIQKSSANTRTAVSIE